MGVCKLEGNARQSIRDICVFRFGAQVAVGKNKLEIPRRAKEQVASVS